MKNTKIRFDIEDYSGLKSYRSVDDYYTYNEFLSDFYAYLEKNMVTSVTLENGYTIEKFENMFTDDLEKFEKYIINAYSFNYDIENIDPENICLVDKNAIHTLGDLESFEVLEALNGSINGKIGYNLYYDVGKNLYFTATE